MQKFYIIIGIITLFGCENYSGDSYGQQNLNGLWVKDYIYIDFSDKSWKCLSAMDNMPPFFNGDELYAYPDGFDTYEDYSNAGKILPEEFVFTLNEGHFEKTSTILTLYDDNEKYIIKYEINNNELKLSCLNKELIKIFYDSSLYRPFNKEVRLNNSVDLNGIWNKKE
jgi:hypothetical protein